jgi:hypothetical protein
VVVDLWEGRMDLDWSSGKVVMLGFLGLGDLSHQSLKSKKFGLLVVEGLVEMG